MFDEAYEEVLLIPLNFAEIVAKSKAAGRPVTASMCEQAYAQAEAEGVQAFWWAARFAPGEVKLKASH